MADPIETFAAKRESDLSAVLIAAIDGYLDTIDLTVLASSLDDIDANHIRRQIALILGLDDTGFPDELDTPFGDGLAALATLAGAIAALAASQARHTLNTNSATVREANAAAGEFLSTFRLDTANAIRAAIESATYGSGNPIRAVGTCGDRTASQRARRGARRSGSWLGLANVYGAPVRLPRCARISVGPGEASRTAARSTSRSVSRVR